MKSKKRHLPEGIDTNNRKEVFEPTVFHPQEPSVLNIFPQRIFDRKEVFEPTVFHPQEPSVLNIFPQRIFDTNTLFRSSSYQKPGLPAYLHQAAAVPTNVCIKQLLQHKLSTINNFASQLPSVHGWLGHVNIYSDAAGNNSYC